MVNEHSTVDLIERLSYPLLASTSDMSKIVSESFVVDFHICVVKEMREIRILYDKFHDIMNYDLHSIHAAQLFEERLRHLFNCYGRLIDR